MTIDNIIQTTEITSLPFKVVSLRKTLKRDRESKASFNAETQQMNLDAFPTYNIQKKGNHTKVLHTVLSPKHYDYIQYIENNMYKRNWLCFLRSLF